MRALVSLSGMDVAFLSLETPSTPMNMLGALVLDPSTSSGGYSYERVLALMEERLPRLAPFRRRLVAVPLGLDHPVWVDDPGIRVRDQVYRLRAPAPGSDQVLGELVARFAAQPLDRTLPLWELCVVEGLSEGRVALVFKLHHAIADGVSAAQLLLQILDPSPELTDTGEPYEHAPSDAAPSGRRALLAHALSRLPQRSARLARLLRDSARSAVAGMGRFRRRAAAGSETPMAFSAPRLPWNAATSQQRTVGFGRARLADVKRINAVFGTTVNQVVLAACTQALRKYLAAHGGAPDVPLVAAIPVSLRGTAEPGSYGNRISAFLVHLPVQIADPLEQLHAVRHASASSRQLHDELGVSALGEWAEFLSTRLLVGAARFYSDQKLAGRHRPLHNLVISNVRGPSVPLYAAGARLTAAHLLGPVMEGAAMNITVVSYAGSIDIGVIACGRAVPHVGDIALGFGAAVAELFKIALQETPETGALRDGRGTPGTV